MSDAMATTIRMRERVRWAGFAIREWWAGPPKDVWEAEYRAMRSLPGWAQKSLMLGSYGDFARGTPSERYFHEPPPLNRETMLWAWQFAQMHWMPQAAVGKVALEATRQGDAFKPKFAKQCEACLTDYDEQVETCKSCRSIRLREPDPGQLLFIKQVFAQPDAEKKQSLGMMLTRWARYVWTISNWYMHLRFPLCPGETVQHDHTVCTRPVAFEPLPSEYTLPYRGKPLAFCPACYRPDRTAAGERLGQVCDDCGGDRYRLVAYTRYNWKGRPVARYYAQEIVHGMVDVEGDGFAGRPRILSVGNVVRAMYYSELFEADTYSKREIPESMLVIPGVAQAQINLAFAAAKQEKKLDRSKRTLWTLGLGGAQAKEPKLISLVPDNVAMQREAMSRMHRENIAAWAGVSPQTLGFQVPGKLGRETEMLEVSENTVEAVQASIEDPINRVLLPMFGVTDWEWEMKSPKRDDLLRKATIQGHVLANAEIAERLGREAEIAEDALSMKVGPKRALLPTPGGPGPLGGPPRLPGGGVSLPALPAPAIRQDPRNLPPGSAPLGLTALEDEFAQATQAAYEQEFGRALDGLGWRAGRAEIDAALRGAAARTAERLGALAQEYVTNMAELSIGEEGTFSRPDRNALAALAARPEAFFSAIRTFPASAAEAMREQVRLMMETEAPADLKDVVKQLRLVAAGETYQLERIARTEATRLASAGREIAWRQVPGNAEQRVYRWVAARDQRTDAVCEQIAAASPYTLDEIKRLTASFGFGEWLPHPNCRCTVVRDPTLLITGEAEVP